MINLARRQQPARSPIGEVHNRRYDQIGIDIGIDQNRSEYDQYTTGGMIRSVSLGDMPNLEYQRENILPHIKNDR